MRRTDAALSTAFLFVCAAVAAAPAPPAKKPLTLERVTSGAGSEPPLVARGAFQTKWRDARRLTYLLAEGGDRNAKPSLWEYDVETGKKTKLAEPLAVPGEEGTSEKEPTPRTLPFADALFSPDGGTLLLTGEGDLFAFDLSKKKLTRL